MNHYLRRFISLPFAVGIIVGIGSTVASASLLGSSIFDDVERGAYYDQAVGEMYGAGIIKGYDSSHFGPNDYVTRGQIAVLMKRLRDELKGNVAVTTQSSSSSRSSSSSVQVVNNPHGAFRFSIEKLQITETSAKASVSVVRTGGSDGEATVHFQTSSGSATSGQDYDETSGTLSFKDKETSRVIEVKLRDDTASEGSETFVISLTNPTGGTMLISPSSLTVTILDNESGGAASSTSSSAGAGVFNFSAASYGVAENAGSVSITVNRTGGTKGAVTVNYATSNSTAIGGTDYSSTSGTLNFADGDGSKTFTVAVNDDSEIDGNKTVNLVLSATTGGAALGTQSTANLIIADNETATSGSGGTFRFSTQTYSALESTGVATITVQRTAAYNGTVSIKYTTNDGTATSGSDYNSTSGTMTFAPGEAAKTFTITIKSDTLSEGEETVNLIISEPTGGASLGSPTTATLKIAG